MYVKSIYTNAVYEMDSMPKFGGWEMVGKEEYLKFKAELDNPTPKGLRKEKGCK